MPKRSPKRIQIVGMPEVLAIEEMLANAIVAWFDEMLKTYMNDPSSNEARMLVMDAFALAMVQIAERDANPQALLDHLKAHLSR